MTVFHIYVCFFHLLNSNLFAIVDVDTLLGGLAVYATTVECVVARLGSCSGNGLDTIGIIFCVSPSTRCGLVGQLPELSAEE